MWNDVRVILDISKKKKKSYFRAEVVLKTRKDCETSRMTHSLGNFNENLIEKL